MLNTNRSLAAFSEPHPGRTCELVEAVKSVAVLIHFMKKVIMIKMLRSTKTLSTLEREGGGAEEAETVKNQVRTYL